MSVCVLPTVPTLVCATGQGSVRKSSRRSSFETAAMSLLLWVGFPRHLSLRLWRHAWSMCSVKVLISKILFNWVASLTFFSHVDPLKGSILLGTEEIVHVKNCNSAPFVSLQVTVYYVFSCFSIASGLHTWAVSWWRLPRGNFRAGRKNIQIQPGVGVLALGLFVFGNEMSSVLAVNCNPSETWVGNGL